MSPRVLILLCVARRCVHIGRKDIFKYLLKVKLILHCVMASLNIVSFGSNPVDNIEDFITDLELVENIFLLYCTKDVMLGSRTREDPNRGPVVWTHTG